MSINISNNISDGHIFQGSFNNKSKSMVYGGSNKTRIIRAKTRARQLPENIREESQIISPSINCEPVPNTFRKRIAMHFFLSFQFELLIPEISFQDSDFEFGDYFLTLTKTWITFELDSKNWNVF